MSEDTGSDQQDLAGVAETTQAPTGNTPTKTSAQPGRRKPATPRSQAERLLGVKDPEPEPAERPVTRKRTPKPKAEPKPAPRTIEPLGIDWDLDLERIGAELAAELAGGAE